MIYFNQWFKTASYTFTLIAILSPLNSYSKTYASCDKIVSKILSTEQQMRSGYTAKQGEKLKSRLRHLKTQRNKCERHAEKQKAQSKAKNQRHSTVKAPQKPIKKNQKKHNGYQDYSQFNWSYTQASDECKAYWKKQQAIENKRIKALNKKYAGAIKDAKKADNNN